MNDSHEELENKKVVALEKIAKELGVLNENAGDLICAVDDMKKAVAKLGVSEGMSTKGAMEVLSDEMVKAINDGVETIAATMRATC